MSLIIPANSAVGGGYDVDNSLRFNVGSNDFLSRTIGTPTDEDKWTFSVWLKVTSDAPSNLFGILSSGDYPSAYETIHLNGSDQLFYHYNDGGGANHGSTKYSGIIRDPSAWYNLIVSRNGTAGKIYINGTDVTTIVGAFNNSTNVINKSGGTLRVGHSERERTGQSWNGYMSEVVFCDGQLLDETSFGEFDSDSGIWKPIDVSGLTFGTNGFYLDFEDSAALGDDVSGNGNDFTVNNLTSIDQTTDTPTNNFATLNPLHYYLDNTTENGNLTYKPTTTSTYPYIFSTLGVTKGKWYVEFKKFNGSSSLFGILDADKYPLPVFLGHGTDDWGWLDSGWFYNNGSNVLAVNTYSANDIVGLALDLDNDALYFSKNGTWETVNGSSGDPESGSAKTGAIEIASDKTWLIGVGTGGGSPNDLNLNFGSPPYSESGGNSDGNGYGNFNQAVPNGYYAINTKNLSEFG